MKNLNLKYSLFLLIWLITVPAISQDIIEEEQGNKPTRPHFDGGYIIENQSVVVPKAKTFEFMIQHRFGEISSGIKDFWGLYLPSNIRLGFSYTLFDNIGIGSLKGPVAIGMGTTKDNRILDFSIKYGMLQQTRNNIIPVSVTYFFNTAVETKNKTEELPNGNESDRYSYFHQLIISRRFSSKISIQVAPSVSHYNVVDPLLKNDHVALAGGGRVMLTPQTSVLFNVDQPLTKHKFNNPQPNLSLGLGVATSAHSFQIFVTNYQSIVPQRNNVYNQNDPFDQGLLIGFNISRTWSF